MAEARAELSGIKLQRETATPGIYAEIGQILTLSGPLPSWGDPQTVLRDWMEEWKQFITELHDRGGAIAVELLLEPDEIGHQALYNLLTADVLAPHNYRVQFPLAAPWSWSKWAFAAQVISFEPRVLSDKSLVAMLSFKVSGEPMFS